MIKGKLSEYYAWRGKASLVWSGLNFSLGIISWRKDSETIKGGGCSEGQKGRQHFIVMLMQNKKGKRSWGNKLFQNVYIFHKYMNKPALINESHPWRYMHLNFLLIVNLIMTVFAFSIHSFCLDISSLSTL